MSDTLNSPKWPTFEEATGRIALRLRDYPPATRGVAIDVIDLIVTMREIGRLMAENVKLVTARKEGPDGEYSVRELLLLAQNHIPPSQIALRSAIEGWLASHPASSDELAALRAQNADLVAALTECANDLEAELLHRYGSPVHPALQRQFDRDFSIVVSARAAIAAAGEP